MSQYLFYLIVGLMSLTLIFALLVLASFAASAAGGGNKNAYRSKIFGGIAYVLLGFLGEIGNKLVGSGISWLLALSIAFVVLGGLMVQSGLTKRRASR